MVIFKMMDSAGIFNQEEREEQRIKDWSKVLNYTCSLESPKEVLNNSMPGPYPSPIRSELL